MAPHASQTQAVENTMVATAVRGYEAAFLQLAADVPEFGIWAMLAEHATTHANIRDLHSGLGDVLGTQALALGRLQRLLEAMVGDPQRAASPRRDAVVATNRAVLDEPILPQDVSRHLDAVRIPSVFAIHQSPKCRQIVYAAGSRPADDSWWAQQRFAGDVDLFLGAYLAGTASLERPLLVLGHPGAGKSLLTKVIAARLPVESFTAVRVALRHVDASAPIYTQIQQAIHVDTHGRVDWSALVDESAETIRVVLLDGFDELLQATPTGRPQYLQEIEEFQRREAVLGRPVAVIVTSRTIVAEQARIPHGTVVLRLEEFGRPEITRWTEAWNEVNHDPVQSDMVRPLSTESALAHIELTRQPLLLLMFALYVADPMAPPLDVDLTRAALYERLFDTFVRREVAKTRPLTDEGADGALDARLWRLTIAAFAIFNRGGQYVSDTALGADLAALDDSSDGHEHRGDERRLAWRIAGEFFFVHTAEADARQQDEARHSYEFLHATFGEYLIARHVVRALLDLSASDGRRIGRDTDDELFALLSHQPLAARRTILTFVQEILEALPTDRHAPIARVLERLFQAVRNRHGTDRFAGYRPTRIDRWRELAAYSVNLITLRAHLGPVAIPRLMPSGESVTPWWRSTVRAWQPASTTRAGRQSSPLSMSCRTTGRWCRASGGPFRSPSPRLATHSWPTTRS
ncbi:NACHT domain-containing protein [Dactylosporangium cerinum]